jgi:hypothetical protein
MASKMFDFPEPLRPVIALNEASQPVIEVRTGYDLKPSRTSSSIRMASKRSTRAGGGIEGNLAATDASRPIQNSPRSRSWGIPKPCHRPLSLSLVMSTSADIEFTDLSDLTELSSGDEAASSVPRGSKGKQPARDSFVLKNTLRPPRSVSYTTKWLHGAANPRASR